MMPIFIRPAMARALLSATGAALRRPSRPGARTPASWGRRWEDALAVMASDPAGSECARLAVTVCSGLTHRSALATACRHVATGRAYPADHTPALTRARLLREARPDLGAAFDALVIEGVRTLAHMQLRHGGLDPEARRAVETALDVMTPCDVPTVMVAVLGRG